MKVMLVISLAEGRFWRGWGGASWTILSFLKTKLKSKSFRMSCSQWRGERILGMTATSSPRSVVFLQPRQLRAAVQVITSLAVNYLRKLVLATANLRPLKCNPVSPSLFLRFCSRKVGETGKHTSLSPTSIFARRVVTCHKSLTLNAKSNLNCLSNGPFSRTPLGQSCDEGEFRKIFKLYKII